MRACVSVVIRYVSVEMTQLESIFLLLNHTYIISCVRSFFSRASTDSWSASWRIRYSLCIVLPSVFRLAERKSSGKEDRYREPCGMCQCSNEESEPRMAYRDSVRGSRT